MQRGERRLEILFYCLALGCLAAAFVRDRIDPPVYAPEPRSADVLRVLTWNVGAGLDGGGLREEHLEHIAGVLRAADPDLAFLQEVRSTRQGERLRERLGEGWASASSAGALALAQRGRIESFSLERAFRLRTVGVVYRSEGLEPVAAIGLHAEAFSARSRNESIGSMTTALMERSEALKILAGDMNFDLDLDKRRDLLTDNEHLDVETYNFVGLRLHDAGRGTGSTAEPDRRLDYVFVSPDWPVRSVGVWKKKRAPGMDHDPVIADLGRGVD